jgi:hypothetical protein
MAMVGILSPAVFSYSVPVRYAFTNNRSEKLTGLKRQLVEAARERRPGG